MVGLTTDAKGTALTALQAVMLYASLHTAEPDATGSNEMSGGSPAYARQAVTWAAPAGGSMSISNTPFFDVPGGTATHVGFWDDPAAGTFQGAANCSDVTRTGQGTYTLNSATVIL